MHAVGSEGEHQGGYFSRCFFLYACRITGAFFKWLSGSQVFSAEGYPFQAIRNWRVFRTRPRVR